MKQTLCTVASNLELMPGVYLMWIEAPDIAVTAQPGQFITVRCGDFTLRRPFSVHQISSQELALLFKVAGKGTLWLSQQKKGDRIDILGPLGKGFTIEPKARNLLLVAGGIGIAPLVFLMQHASSQHQITLIHGASAAAQLYPFSSTSRKPSKLPPLPNGVQYIPITEDGSMGQKGKVTDILPDFLNWADQIYACGPVDMYKAMALSLNPSPLKGEEKTIVGEGLVPSHNLKLKKCQVSLEVRMGCGFGACYSCTIKTRKGLKRVCRDGPVFELDDIIWQEVKI
ncbi:MAG: dihydroorotate dehydrogenase electron transfer subunit [Chloroflexi bacterium]|nr:dihydroorotate dehydrogenase electron transfer subunit [Chloroflexota bacterium]